MPYNRPTLAQLIDRSAAEIESRLPGGDARLRRQMLAVLARVLSGAAHGLHGHVQWVAGQILPDSADAEFLTRHAAIWGVEWKVAVKAAGEVIFTGQNGAEIPAAALLQRADGEEYVTVAEATVAGGQAVVAVEAVEPGASGNFAAGTLTLVAGLEGVSGAATVGPQGLAGGADEETPESLRARLVSRIQDPPQGGSIADYRRWALEVSGVTRAWVYPAWLGLGTVGVAIVNDDADPIVPDAATVVACQDHIDLARPVTADVVVFAPVAVALDPEISVTPNTAAVRAAVEAELRDLLRREAEPGGTILLSHIREAISLAAGEADHTLIAPAANVVLEPGEITVLGEITWT